MASHDAPVDEAGVDVLHEMRQLTSHVVFGVVLVRADDFGQEGTVWVVMVNQEPVRLSVEQEAALLK